MSHYKKIYIPVFLSLLLHGLFIYFFTINLSKPVQINMGSTLFVEIVKPEAEKSKIIQRKMIGSPSTLAKKGTATPLKPFGGLKMAGTISNSNSIQSKPLMPRREVAIQASSPMSVQAAKIPMVLLGRTMTARPKPNTFSPYGKTFLVGKKETFIKRASYSGLSQVSDKTKNVYSLQYNIGTEGKLDMELFKYSTPFVQGAGDATTTSLGISHQGFTGYTQSAQWLQNDTTSFQNASTSGAVNGGSWAGMRFHTMVMGKIENAKVYPEIARRTGIEGDVFIRFSIFPDGRVKEVELIPPTTDHKILKKSAVNTIRNAAPYLPIPVEISTYESLVMKVKISYRLN